MILPPMLKLAKPLYSRGMKLFFLHAKKLLVALILLGAITACGAGKGCDCPSFKVNVELNFDDV